ncbi:MAG TPA: hypothetical protein VFT27_03505 [Actinomycetota bacterium]|nr:hypothetical protein [Actinomycetota bacterium]
MNVRPAGRLFDFVKLRPEVEAVLQHVGRQTWDLVLISVDGTWVREEYPSVEAAEAASRALGVSVHQGWDDPRMSRRMDARDHWGGPGGQRRAL